MPKTTPSPKTETLFQRWDALLIGSVLAGLIVYAVKHWEVAQNASQKTLPFLHTHTWSFPAVFIALYLVLVHFVQPQFFPLPPPPKNEKEKQKLLEERQARINNPSVSDYLLRAWNFFLAFLSLCMLLGLGSEMVIHAWETGFVEMICDHNLTRWQGPLFFWMILFMGSKYLELIDTVFLVVRRRPIGLLHWYHHTTVLLYTWGACKARFSVGWLFALVNASVHTVMYWYYYRAACGVRLTYSKFITTFQLSQMVAGLFFTSIWMYFHYFTDHPCPCDHTEPAVIGALIMYASYFLLFAQFYYRRYVARGQAAKDKKAKKKSKKSVKAD